MPPFTVEYPSVPARRSLACNAAADLFGLDQHEPPHRVADGVELDIAPGEVALFTGPSGSGKSSLLRAVAQYYGALDAAKLNLPNVPVIDALPGPVADRLGALVACGLGEGRAVLRTPAELSDGQRYRFRLAFALAQNPQYLALDEFAALLDRPLAKVVAFNLRKLAAKTNTAILAATANTDIIEDLNPDVLVTCRGNGAVAVDRRTAVKKKSAASPPPSMLRTVPSRTGRTSRGGITAATASAS